MNKKEVNANIDYAYEALKECHIATDNKIVKTFRGQISSFGAAVEMGSLKPAILFFSDQGGSSVKRTNLMQAIQYVLLKGNKGEMQGSEDKPGLYVYIKDQEQKGIPEYKLKERVLNAAIAIKLAMNLFELTKE